MSFVFFFFSKRGKKGTVCPQRLLYNQCLEFTFDSDPYLGLSLPLPHPPHVGPFLIPPTHLPDPPGPSLQRLQGKDIDSSGHCDGRLEESKGRVARLRAVGRSVRLHSTPTRHGTPHVDCRSRGMYYGSRNDTSTEMKDSLERDATLKVLKLSRVEVDPCDCVQTEPAKPGRRRASHLPTGRA